MAWCALRILIARCGNSDFKCSVHSRLKKWPNHFHWLIVFKAEPNWRNAGQTKMRSKKQGILDGLHSEITLYFSILRAVNVAWNMLLCLAGCEKCRSMPLHCCDCVVLNWLSGKKRWLFRERGLFPHVSTAPRHSCVPSQQSTGSCASLFRATKLQKSRLRKQMWQNKVIVQEHQSCITAVDRVSESGWKWGD